MPVLTGSLIRVPLGIWTDRYGGRIVMTVLMALTVPAIWLMAYATPTGTSWSSACSWAGGRLVLGRHALCGALVPQGTARAFAMGVYGAGNSGAAVNKFAAPALLAIWLDDGAAGLCRGHAGTGHPVLVLQQQRPGTWCRRT
jgi:NNP family nitrate/nitrite transporter-like MFS transporter